MYMCICLVKHKLQDFIFCGKKAGFGKHGSLHIEENGVLCF